MLLGVLSATAPPGPPLSGLKLWVEGRFGLTTLAWPDHSGNGNDLAIPGGEPVTVVSSAMNGLPGAKFDQTGQQIFAAASAILTAGHDRTVVVVCKPHATGGTFDIGGCVASFRSGLGTAWIAYLGVIGASTYGYSDGAGADTLVAPPVITDVGFIMELSSAVGAAPRLVLNGTDYALTASITTGNDSGAGVFNVGNLEAYGQNFEGPICAVFVYDHIMTEPERTQLRAYLNPLYI